MRTRSAFLITALSLLTVASARAEALVADSDNLLNDQTLVLSLPAGPVDITMNQETSAELIIRAGKGQEVRIDSGYMPRLLKTYHDSALLEINPGGNACPTLFAWITLDAKGSGPARISAPARKKRISRTATRGCRQHG